MIPTSLRDTRSRTPAGPARPIRDDELGNTNPVGDAISFIEKNQG